MNIGRKIRLVQRELFRDAYQDQFGVTHKAYIIKDIREVTIVETKEVPGMWGQGGKYEGWRAQDDDGKSYFCNWENFPDDSITPSRIWWDSRVEWEDADQLYSLTLIDVNGEMVRFNSDEGVM